MKKQWVVVAESSRARFFAVEGRTSPLKEVEDLVNPASRAQDQELVSDTHGRSFDSHGQGGRHAMEPRTEPKKHEMLTFAHEVSERIENARRKGRFEELVLISSPGFLGMLRKNLGDVTQKHISKTINKNLVGSRESEIRDYIFQ